MSISLLTNENDYDLFSSTMTVSNELNCSKVNTTEVSIPTLQLFKHSTGNDSFTSLGFAASLSWNYTGIVTIFYDVVTSASPQLGADVDYLVFGYSTTDFNILGLPEIRGSNGRMYNHEIFVSFNTTITTPVRMQLTKVSSTECNIKLYPITAGSLFPNQIVSVLPFTFDYPTSS